MRALECKMKWGDVNRNVCDAIDAPREADFQVNLPDRETVKALLNKAMKTPYGAAFWLLAFTGMRRGEVCGVRWEHLDLDRGTLNMSGAVGRVDRRLVLTPHKSKTSRRMIHLDQRTVEVLRAHWASQAKMRLALETAYQYYGYVFTNDRGDLTDPDALTRTWQAIYQDFGVNFRLHD